MFSQFFVMDKIDKNFIKNKCPILGCENYYIDTITHEIYNKHGRKMKLYVDDRGRVTVKLSCEKGKQKTIRLANLVTKMSLSPLKKTSKDDIVSNILLCYYNNIGQRTRNYTVSQWILSIREETGIKDPVLLQEVMYKVLSARE